MSEIKAIFLIACGVLIADVIVWHIANHLVNDVIEANLITSVFNLSIYALAMLFAVVYLIWSDRHD